jgi:hypothetical protein
MKKARSDPAKQEGADLSACPGVRGFTEEDWSNLDEEVHQVELPPSAVGIE